MSFPSLVSATETFSFVAIFTQCAVNAAPSLGEECVLTNFSFMGVS